jgi:hypothetical protein
MRGQPIVLSQSSASSAATTDRHWMSMA